MEKLGLLGPFEEAVLLALARLGEAAYGMTVRREAEERLGRPVAIGAVYTTLERLEEKGLVSSLDVRDPAAEGTRIVRGRRYFRLEPRGADALAASFVSHRRRWEDVDLEAIRRELARGASR